MTERLARYAAAHPKRMLATWAAIFLLSAGTIGALLPSALTTDQELTASTESQQGYNAIARAFPRPDPAGFVTEIVLVHARVAT